MDSLIHGLTTLATPANIAWLFFGALLGMIGGVVPGLGGPVILSIVLVFIYHIDLTAVLALFLGTHAGSYFSSSISAILLNTPQHPESYASSLDGFPMSQRGEAGRALGISATATCVSGWLGCAALVAFIPLIDYIPNLFHPPEYVGLVAIALILVGTFGTDSLGKAVVSAGLGLMLASIGPSALTGVYRYTFGTVGLSGGVGLVPLALGAFAIPQMVLVFGTASVVARQDMFGREIKSLGTAQIRREDFAKQVLGGVAETLTHWVALIRGAAVGVVTGLVPGIGAFAANFLSYGIAQQTSKDRDKFGTGIAEGVIAPEASSLSKEAGHMVPVLALGIPGGVGSALFIAALTIKGVRLGYGFANSYPTIPYEIVWVIALSGLIGTAAGLMLAPWLARVTVVPGPLLVPFIFALGVVGPYVATQSFFEVAEVAVFACLGFVLRRLRYSLAAFVIGLVLGPTFESNVYLTHRVYPGLRFLGQRPIADVLFVIAIGILVIRGMHFHRQALKRRQEAREAGGTLIEPYPLLDPLVTLILLAITGAMTVYAFTNFNFATGAMPEIGGVAACLALISRLPNGVRGYITYRKNKGITSEEPSELPLPISPETGRAPQDANVLAGNLSQTASGPSLAYTVSTNQDDLIELDPIEDTPQQAAQVHEKAWGVNGQFTREIVGFLWFFGLVVIAALIGFRLAVPLFFVAFSLFGTGKVLRAWKTRILFAIIGGASVTGISIFMLSLLHLTYTPLLTL